jgi:hypothetical protein
MARKTKSGAGRRPGQQRPRTAAPARRVATTTPATDVSIEERLAELERERELLLAAAQGVAARPAESEEAEDDGAGAHAEDGEEAPEPVAAAPAATSRVRAAVTPASPSVSGARRVGRVTPAPAAVVKAPPKSVARAADSLDPEDPSIPLERVPYVRADLRRVGVIAAVMIVLIVIADIVVRSVVK